MDLEMLKSYKILMTYEKDNEDLKFRRYTKLYK